MEAKLYVILGSHACRTGMLMLEHKGIEYERVELPAVLHPIALRLHGVGGDRAAYRTLDGRSNLMVGMADRFGTVPVLAIDGRQVKTNNEIARFLDELQPDPPLFPAGAEHRRAVEEAQSWGDDVFQMVARRLALAASLHGPDAMVNRGDAGRLGPLLWRSQTVRRAGTRMLAHMVFRANKHAETDLMAALPGHLDRIDAWAAEGMLNGDELYAADFMIAPSLALLLYRRDLRPEIEGRAAIRLVDRLLPEPAATPSAALPA
jgi:glutathione S-transferase